MDGNFVLALQRHFRVHAWQHRPNEAGDATQ
jgi:hypothetical protein